MNERAATEVDGVAYLTKYSDPRKRAQDAIEMLALQNGKVLVHWRREDGGRKPSMREFRNAADGRRTELGSRSDSRPIR